MRKKLLKTCFFVDPYAETISSTGLDMSDYDEIKAFLWENFTTLKPLCKEAVA